MYFDGPRAPEQAAAADRAGRERIWPTISGLGGLVGAYVLHGHDLAAVIITLTTSTQTLDAAEHAAMSTELLPGEDPRCSQARTASRSITSRPINDPPPRQPA